jgi:hypothetical protein
VKQFKAEDDDELSGIPTSGTATAAATATAPATTTVTATETVTDGDGQPCDFKLRKLVVNLGNAYVRLAAKDRRKVMRLIEKFAFGNASSVSYWDRWCKDEMKRCFLQMKPISPKVADDFRRWANQLLKTGRNNKLHLNFLMGELEVREWIEDPESDF